MGHEKQREQGDTMQQMPPLNSEARRSDR
jgi:hypothetical protein